jgi:predicted CXXCH cytochrome family protein
MGTRRPRVLFLGAAALALSGLWWATASAQPSTSGSTAPTTQPTATAATSQPAGRPLAELTQNTGLLGGLIGSKHDFTGGTRSGRELCLPCHTPHLMRGAPPRLDQRQGGTLPLRPYETAGVVLDSWSLVCLGCHDGVTAPDVYTSAHATLFGDQVGNERLGTTGLSSHPVGTAYPTAVHGYRSRAQVEAAGLPLPDGHIQCATCHDAHNARRIPRMLRVSNDRSRLCLTCHEL